MSETSILEFVITELTARKGSWPEIGHATGVPYFTITKIAQGKTKDPGISTVEKLANYFKQHSKTPPSEAVTAQPKPTTKPKTKHRAAVG